MIRKKLRYVTLKYIYESGKAPQKRRRNWPTGGPRERLVGWDEESQHGDGETVVSRSLATPPREGGEEGEDGEEGVESGVA